MGIIYLLQKQQLWPIQNILDHQTRIVLKPSPCFLVFEESLALLAKACRPQGGDNMDKLLYEAMFFQVVFPFDLGLDITGESKPIIPNIALGRPLFRDNVCR